MESPWKTLRASHFLPARLRPAFLLEANQASKLSVETLGRSLSSKNVLAMDERSGQVKMKLEGKAGFVYISDENHRDAPDQGMTMKQSGKAGTGYR
jgi:hypothetical protein